MPARGDSVTRFRCILRPNKTWRRGKRYEADLRITTCSDGTLQLALSFDAADVWVTLSPEDAARVIALAADVRLEQL
jgi:hypothetical protein